MELFQNLLSTPYEFLSSYGLPFVLVLSVLVFVHEWGHFIVARMCGVKVDVFSIGFGKEILGWTAKNGTRWKFSLIPLGGYVQMFGDSDPASSRHDGTVEGEEGEEAREYTDAEKSVAFYSQPVWKRSLIVVAGPAINFIFAIVLLTGLYTMHGQPYTPPVAASIIEGSPAEIAGIKPDDKIVSINGETVTSFQDIVQTVAVNLNQPLEIELVHYKGDRVWEDKIHTVMVTPTLVEEADRFGFKHSRGRMGIYSPPGESETLDHSVWSAFLNANKETAKLTLDTLKAIGQMVVGVRSTDELGGILRIGAYAGEFAQAGFISMVTFAALLSINLGLINLFPIPLLDGGHLAFYAYEVVRGKPIGSNAQEYVLRFGFVLVMGLMLFATWNDLVQLKVVDYVVDLVS